MLQVLEGAHDRQLLCSSKIERAPKYFLERVFKEAENKHFSVEGQPSFQLLTWLQCQIELFKLQGQYPVE
jgi:hypothetical protein